MVLSIADAQAMAHFCDCYCRSALHCNTQYYVTGVGLHYSCSIINNNNFNTSSIKTSITNTMPAINAMLLSVSELPLILPLSDRIPVVVATAAAVVF